MILAITSMVFESCDGGKPTSPTPVVSPPKEPELVPEPPTPEEIKSTPALADKQDTPDKPKVTKPAKSKAPNSTTAITTVPLRPESNEKTLEDYIKEFSGDSPVANVETTKKAANLMEGRISYSLPDTIKVDEVFTATVMVSDTAFLESRMVKEVLNMSLNAGEKITEKDIKLAQIRIAELMRAELIDPSKGENFTIEPEGFQEQHLLEDNEMHVVFQWNVTANKPGDFPLILNLDAVFFKGEKEITQNIPVFKEKVFVKNVADTSWLNYVFAGLIAAIISALFMKFRSRKEEGISEKETDIEKIIEEIASGETVNAITLLRSRTPKISPTNENLLVSHLAEFNDIRRQFNGGMIERAEMQSVTNRIHNSLLEICDELKG